MTRVHQIIWRHVLDRCEYDSGTGCVRWTGCLIRGYGSISVAGRNQSVHRVVYEALVGAIPVGLTLDHDCHTRAVTAGTCLGGESCPHRACVQPSHLVAMSVRDNVLCGNTPAAANASKECCVHGHPFTADNTYIRVDGARSCRVCSRKSLRKYNSTPMRQAAHRDYERARRAATASKEPMYCPGCGEGPLPRAATGRRREWCSRICRERWQYAQRKAKTKLTIEPTKA